MSAKNSQKEAGMGGAITPEQMAEMSQILSSFEDKMSFLMQQKAGLLSLKVQGTKAAKQLASLRNAFLPDEVRTAIMVQLMQTTALCDVTNHITLEIVRQILEEEINKVKSIMEMCKEQSQPLNPTKAH